MKHRSIALAGAAAAVALTLTACGASSGAAGGGSGAGGGDQGTPATGGTLRFLSQSDFSHLDPARGYDGGVDNFYQLIYRTLTMWKPGSGHAQVVPDLATSLGTPSGNYKVWTFHLKSGLYFSNGQPITSQDVKFGVERSWDPQAGIGSPYAKTLIAAPASYKGPYVSGSLNTIATPDSKTIVFHLKQSYPDFSYAVQEPVYVPFPVGTGNDDSFDKHPIASGPYEVSDYQPGSSLTLVRNKRWQRATDPNRAARPDKIVFTYGLSAATIDQRLLANQGTDQDAVGLWAIQPSTVAKIQTAQMKARTVQGVQGCTGYVGLNTTKKPLNNLKVRQAIEWATDKQTIVQANGGTVLASPATAIESPSVPDRTTTDVYATPGNTGNVTKAKALLAQAGLPHGFTMNVQVSNDPVSQAEAVAFQAGLARAGIKVQIDAIATASFYQTIGTISQEGDSAMTGWCPDWPGGLTFLPPLFDGHLITSAGNTNLAQINDPSVNNQFASIAKMSSVTAQNQAYARMDVQIQKLAVVVPTVWDNTVMLVGTNVTGAAPSPPWDNGPDLVSLGLKNAGQ
ncbi:MAG TPA: ABC transporter substrate-binding protein [Streptosporangiaceae bacterium]|jgi:peptide/nickel transport system substrate-binding protein